MEDRITQLEKQVKDLQFLINKINIQESYVFDKRTQFRDDIGFYDKTPISQPSTSGTTLDMTTVGGTVVTESNGFGGGLGGTYYTIGDIVKHLKNLGLLAP